MGGGKSERSNLCFRLADGLPYAGLGLRLLPERSIRPAVPHISLWVGGGAVGGRASWANPPPPTPSCSCPPRFPQRCPAVTLFPHIIAKRAHFCSICQGEGRRYYRDGLCRVGWSQSQYMPVVVHECGHLKAAHSSSHARRPSGWSHGETR